MKVKQVCTVCTYSVKLIHVKITKWEVSFLGRNLMPMSARIHMIRIRIAIVKMSIF